MIHEAGSAISAANSGYCPAGRADQARRPNAPGSDRLMTCGVDRAWGGVRGQGRRQGESVRVSEGQDSPGEGRMTQIHFLVFAEMDKIWVESGEMGDRKDGMAVSNIRSCPMINWKVNRGKLYVCNHC